MRTAAPERARRGEVADAIRVEAIELFAARGYRGTTIAAVARRSGLSDAGVLHHYPTKSSLLVAALEELRFVEVSQLAALVDPGGLAALRNLSGWGAARQTRPELLTMSVVLAAESITDVGALRAHFEARTRDLSDKVSRLIADGQTAGEIRPDADPAAEAISLLALVDGLALRWATTNDRAALADGVRTYVDQTIRRLAISEVPACANETTARGSTVDWTR